MIDLSLLAGDDLLGEPPKLWVGAAFQIHPGHVHAGLVMRNHKGNEISI